MPVSTIEKIAGHTGCYARGDDVVSLNPEPSSKSARPQRHFPKQPGGHSLQK